MSKEVDHRNVVIFQEGKLRAFGTITSYVEEGSEFNSTVRVDKGTLMTGDHEMQICREYDVFTDTNGIWVQ